MTAFTDYPAEFKQDLADDSRSHPKARFLGGVLLLLAGLGVLAAELLHVGAQWSVTASVLVSTSDELLYSVQAHTASWGLLFHVILFLTLGAVLVGIGSALLLSPKAVASQMQWLVGLGVWLLAGMIAVGIYAFLPSNGYQQAQRSIENNWVHQFYGGSGANLPHGLTGSLRWPSVAPSAFTVTDRAGHQQWLYREPHGSESQPDRGVLKVKITAVSQAQGKALAEQNPPREGMNR